MNMKGLLFIMLLLFVSCRSQNEKRLEQALEMAGKNRVELEKVLSITKVTK